LRIVHAQRAMLPVDAQIADTSQENGIVNI
jgi:hypothetical protein